MGFRDTRWHRVGTALLAPEWRAVPTAQAAPATIAGCPTLPADNIWNTRIDGLPVHARSDAYLASIGLNTGLKADFGSGTWNGGPIGIPYVVVPGSQPKLSVDFTWPGESDNVGYPIPANPPIEGGSNSSGDRHILMVDQDNCVLYELYSAYPRADGGWDAGSGAVFPLTSNALRPAGWTSADAAGLPILPGLARVDEVLAGEIAHALRFTAQVTQRAYDWPARHYASSNTNPNVPPMGIRVRLRADYDISTFTPRNQVILTALKQYGMFLADNGSNWYISGAPDERWNNDELRQLANVRGNAFEVVDESGLMVSNNSGQAGGAQPPATSTPSVQNSPTATATRTPSPSRTPILTSTVPPTTGAATATRTRTPTPTKRTRVTATPAASRTPSRTPTTATDVSPSPTNTPTSTATATPTGELVASLTPTATRTASLTRTLTLTATATATPTATRTPTTTPGGGAQTITLQGSAAFADTWISPDYPTTSFGTTEMVHLQGAWTPDRLLLRPDLSGLPAGAHVQQATLQVYAYSASSSGNTMSSYRVLTPWGPSTATYDSPWSSPGLLAGTDYAATPTGSALQGGVGWLTVDVTSAVQAWSQGAPNYGVALRLTSGAANAHYRVYLSEYTTLTLRPKLTIQYSQS